MTKILYLKTQNVPHTPQNDDETKVLQIKLILILHTLRPLNYLGVQSKVNKNVWGIVIWGVELILPQKNYAPQNFPNFGAL